MYHSSSDGGNSEVLSLGGESEPIDFDFLKNEGIQDRGVLGRLSMVKSSFQMW